MRIYQINVTARFSTGNLVGAIHSELIRQGHEARFAYGFGGEKKENYFQVADIWTLRLNARWARMTGNERVFAKNAAKKLISDIIEFDPDAIHIHNLHGNYVDYFVFLEWLSELNKPVIITLHDCWFYTGGCYHYTVNHCGKWRTECKSCNHQLGYMFHKLHPIENDEFCRKRDALSRIDKLYITTVSEWLKEEAKKSFLGNREIIAIPNGIDCSLYYPRDVGELQEKYNCSDKVVLLGVASSWSDRKGLNTWKLISEHLDESYQIILVGLNTEQLKALPKKIIGLPRVNNEKELRELYSLADIYVNLSPEETFGLPTVEAMACGTPVVVLNSTANPELVDDSVGRIAASPSVEDVLKALNEVRLIGKRNMTASCIERANTLYSIKIMTERYLNLYRKVLGRV